MTAIHKDKWYNPMENYIVIKIDSRQHDFFLRLHTWLRANTVGKWATTSTRVGFEKEADAVIFKLSRWYTG